MTDQDEEYFEAPPVPQLSPELAEKARLELNETDETRSRAILLLRQAFQVRHPGVLPRDDDSFLLRFLRARKFDVERTISLLIKYCTYRREHANLFTITAAELEKVLQKRIICLLPSRDKNGCAIVLISTKNIDLKETPFEMLMRSLIFMCEKVIEDQATQINGVVVLYDLAGYPLGLVNAIRNEEKHAAMDWTENCFPIRFNGAHVINEPWYVTIILAIVRTFTTRKILSRVFLYGSNIDSLRQSFDAAILPPPFGTLENYDFAEYFRADLEKLKAAEARKAGAAAQPEAAAEAATQVQVAEEQPEPTEE